MRDPKKSGNGPVKGSAGKEIVVTYHEISIDDRDVVILCGGRDHLDEMSVREKLEGLLIHVDHPVSSTDFQGTKGIRFRYLSTWMRPSRYRYLELAFINSQRPSHASLYLENGR